MTWTLLQNSLLVSGLSTLLAVALGILSALLLASLGSRWRRGLLGAAVIALALPPFLVTNCWLYLLGHTGVWRTWFPASIYSLWGTIWILALLTWPITLFLVLGAWQRLEPSQLESEPNLRGWPMIRWLLLPLAAPALGLAAVLTLVLTFNNFAVPAILQTKVYAAELWVSFSTTFDYGAVVRLSWPLLAAPVLLLLVLKRRNIHWPAVEDSVPPRLFRSQLGTGWFWTSAGITAFLIFVSVGLPLWQLLGTKPTWTELPKAFAAAKPALQNSFLFALLASGASAGIGLFVWRWRLGHLFWVPCLVPGVFVGIVLIFLLNRPGFSAFYQSAGVVILGFMLRYLALSWATASRAMRAVDPDLTDSARLLGASSWQLLRLVQWPQIAPVMAAVCYVTYLLCLWDVETLVLIVPPGGETLALRVFNLLHYGHNDQVNALCTLLLGLAVLPLLAWTAARPLTRIFRTRFKRPQACDGQQLSPRHEPRRSRREEAHSIPFEKSQSLLTSAPTVQSNLDTSPTGEAGRATPCAPQPATGLPNGAHGVTRPTTLRNLFVTARVAIRKQHAQAAWGAFGIVAVFIGVASTGCSPAASSAARVESRIFSSVQVLGSRGTGMGQFNKPRSVAVDASDNLYVVDMTGRVQKFSPEGAFLTSWQMPQTDLGKPKGMCRDAAGRIVVIEPHYSRVNHFSTNGHLAAQWGVAGTNRGQLMFPRAAAVNSRGEIYVSEYGKVERVQKFSAQGRTFLHAIGQAGSAENQFNRPEGLGIDRQDRLYVADSCNHRIQVFSADGAFLRAYGRAGHERGALSYPYDIQVDQEGRQYVCEFGNSRIQIFDEQGRSVEILGGPGATPGRFSNPWGLALDSKGNLYVADALNHRVQKFLRKNAS